MAEWKRPLFIGIGWGLGTALGLAILVGGFLWYQSRPKPEKPWNQSAIKASPTGATARLENDRAVGDFRYSLQNTTDKDYRMPTDAKIMVRLAQDMSYRDFPDMTWEQNLYIPAGQKVNISITLPIHYSDFNFSKEKADDEKQLRPFLESRLAEIDGFVLFDPTNRYKSDFPNAWPETMKRIKEREASKTGKSEAK